MIARLSNFPDYEDILQLVTRFNEREEETMR